MISFDLKCRADHVFEIWFRSSADHDDQAARGLIACPVCGDSQTVKAVMAPHVAAKGNRAVARPAQTAPLPVPSAPAVSPPAVPMMTTLADQLAAAAPEHIRPLISAMAQAQAAALAQSTWVGGNFAAEARALHAAVESGEIETPPAIHGQATPAQAEALLDDGIAIMPLLVPVVPPEMQN
jgi:hypothetical protein